MVRFLHGGGCPFQDCFWRIDSNEPGRHRRPHPSTKSGTRSRHTKTLPGRKTDVLECQWLQKLHTFGLLNNSFRPPEEIQVLRTYLRQRENLVTAAYESKYRQQQMKWLAKQAASLNLQLIPALEVSG
jgi:hypothetical protein